MITRLDDAGIKGLLGDAALEHMRRRVRGGEAGHKGVRYEHFFAAHRVARLARKYLEKGEDAIIEWQSPAFVDDVVVRRDGRRSFKGYQLKNAQRVSWTAGDVPMMEDFAAQRAVCHAEGYQDIRLRAVCSNTEVAQSMRDTVPPAIADYSKAFQFPYGPVVLPVLGDHGWLGVRAAEL